MNQFKDRRNPYCILEQCSTILQTTGCYDGCSFNGKTENCNNTMTTIVYL